MNARDKCWHEVDVCEQGIIKVNETINAYNKWVNDCIDREAKRSSGQATFATKPYSLPQIKSDANPPGFQDVDDNGPTQRPRATPTPPPQSQPKDNPACVPVAQTCSKECSDLYWFGIDPAKLTTAQTTERTKLMQACYDTTCDALIKSCNKSPIKPDAIIEYFKTKTASPKYKAQPTPAPVSVPLTANPSTPPVQAQQRLDTCSAKLVGVWDEYDRCAKSLNGSHGVCTFEFGRKYNFGWDCTQRLMNCKASDIPAGRCTPG
jgi:hypothetical protein